MILVFTSGKWDLEIETAFTLYLISFTSCRILMRYPLFLKVNCECQSEGIVSFECFLNFTNLHCSAVVSAC